MTKITEREEQEFIMAVRSTYPEARLCGVDLGAQGYHWQIKTKLPGLAYLASITAVEPTIVQAWKSAHDAIANRQ